MSGKGAHFDLPRLARELTRLNRWSVRTVQLVIFLASGIAAFLLRFDFIIPKEELQHLQIGLCIWVLVKIVVFHLFRLDRGWWRYVSVPDLLRLATANLVGSAIAGVALLLLSPPGFPRSLYILDSILCLILTASIRLAARMAFEAIRVPNSALKKRTLIYGAGDAGVSLLREIRQNQSLSYEIIGFIDDNPAKVGASVYHVKVFGGGEMLSSLVVAHAIEMVLIALPSATGEEMASILKHCQDANVAYRTVPSLGEIIESSGLVAQIRDVAVEDLLGRHPVQLDDSGIRAKIQGKVVAVTGAAGSIGSELCRQIARFRPAAIIAYESAETALFYIEREMRENFPDVRFHAEIGDIRNPSRLEEVFTRYAPSILYHAAAYKHVPMMEEHAFEAVENNVLGTWNTAAAAARCGIADFVMISSDKAVRPTNVMGATKRVAELLINSLQNNGTNYVSVRFGNVLGSNGSVIPLFKQQIAARKPVTVTHPDMRRYFMTIPEAAQLVLQASTMGHGGEIFVLDMGDPVRIVDLAHNLIQLSGLRPGEDIKIEFTGMRPGEKLYEELAHQGEEVRPTYHPKIKIFAEHQSGRILEQLELLRQCCLNRNLADLILHLKDLVPDYNPSAHILRRIVPPVESAQTALTNAR